VDTLLGQRWGKKSSLAANVAVWRSVERAIQEITEKADMRSRCLLPGKIFNRTV
jgi:hypothetical protein